MEQDSQAIYLKNLVSTKSPVIAENNIYNERGVLLLREGSPIDSKRAKILTLHKLLKPIEVDISLSQPLSSVQIFKNINSLIQKHTDLIELENSMQVMPHIKHFCQDYAKHPLLQQKITIMADLMPELYEKSLFCGIFSVCIGKAQGKNRDALRTLFFCGLLHDIGMLHLPKNLHQPCFDKGYSEKEKRQLHAHPIIAHAILQQIQGLEPILLKSILDHHERIDGTGYPYGISGNKLSEAGQLIAMSDVFYSIRFLDVNGKPLNSLVQVLPILQVNGDIYSSEICDLVINTVTSSCNERLRYDRLDETFFNQLLQKIEELNKHSIKARKLLGNLTVTETSSPELQSAITSIKHFSSTAQRSGIEFGSLASWLKSLKNTQEPICEGEHYILEDLEILVQELHFLYLRTSKKIKALPAAQALQIDSNAKTETEDIYI